MKILVLGSRVPWPLHDGGAIATYRMLQSFAKAGCEVTFFTYNTKKHFADSNTLSTHFSFCRVIYTPLDASVKPAGAMKALLTGRNYNISRFMNEKSFASLAELLKTESFDIIQFEGLYTVPFYKTVVALQPAAKLVYRPHNVEYQIWEKLAGTSGGLKRWYLNSLTRGLRKYEEKAVRKFRYIVPITQSDESEFRKIHPNAKYHTAFAGIELTEISHSQQSNTIYHLGSMEWMPNREAVLWFCTDILPLVQKMIPDITFHIAGKGLNPNDPEFMVKGVVNHGEVPDAVSFHASHNIMVVPLRSGSGLRLKTIEAMAMKKAVVSTSTGAEGIPVESGKHLLIADSPQDFATAIAVLLRQPEKARGMGEEASKFAQLHFSNENITANLLQFFREICGNNPDTTA